MNNMCYDMQIYEYIAVTFQRRVFARTCGFESRLRHNPDPVCLPDAGGSLDAGIGVIFFFVGKKPKFN